MGNSDHGTSYMRVGGHDGELRLWHYIYVYSIESRLIRNQKRGEVPERAGPIPREDLVEFARGALHLQGLGFRV